MNAERLQFCVILAFLTHLLFIFGITWKPIPNLDFTPKPLLEITLSSKPSELPVENPKFIAPFHQEASSSEHTELLPQTTESPTITTPEIQSIAELPLPESKINKQIEEQNIVTTTAKNRELITENPLPKNEHQSSIMNEKQRMLSQRIASLSAELAQQQQEYAQQPKKRAVTAATMAATDAKYLYEWRTRMERIGNQNYPDKARQLNLKGNVLLLVAINVDGSLHDVQIKKTSGNKILDEAAIRIVKLAAPFAPLSTEMRENTDILEIIRTWQFGNNQWKQEN